MAIPPVDFHPSFRSRVVIVIQMLLFAVFAVGTGLSYFFNQRIADAHAQIVVRQGLQRASARLTGIVGVASSQNEILQRAIKARLAVRGTGELDLVALLSDLSPAFVARPTLTYVGVGLEANGEYAMLERLGRNSARLRHFAVLPGGGHEIRDYSLDEVGRAGEYATKPWNDYDPRVRPFYQLAKSAGKRVWTDSYFFPANDGRPLALGASLAEPVRDASGRFIGVSDTDIDTASLSAFMGELQHELPGRIFIMETRQDGTFRVVAHSDYSSRPNLRETDLADEPAIRDLAKLTKESPRPAPGEPQVWSFATGGEDEVIGSMALAGEHPPPWTAVVVMPRAALVADVSRLQWLSIGALSVVAVAGIFLSRWIANSLARPLVDLAREVGEPVPEGQRRAIRETGPAELVQFARVYNAQAERVSARQSELRAAGEAARAQADRLQGTNETLRAVARLVADFTRNEQECIRGCLQICCTALDVTRAALWRCEPGSRNLRLVAMRDQPTGTIFEGLTVDGMHYPEYWDAMMRDHRVVVEDASTDPRTNRIYADRMTHLGRVAMLDFPVMVHGEVVGIFSFHLIGAQRGWTMEDEILVLGVADLVALTIERSARIAAERAEADRAGRLSRQNAALSRAARSTALREGRIDEAFRELSEVCTEGLAVGRASLWLVRPTDQVLQLVDVHDAGRHSHSKGREIELTRLPVYHTALASGRCIAASEAQRDPRTVELAAGYIVPMGITSMLDAGVFSRGKLVGVVCCEHVGPGRTWMQEEEIFAGAVADLAALALEASARRTAEDEIERSRERLRLHIEGMPLAAIDWDRNLRIIGWNPAAERIFGYPRDTVVGRHGLFLVHELDRPRVEPIWRELAKGRAKPVERLENRRADGQHMVCDWHHTLLHDEDGGLIGVTSLVEDVTERVQAEAEIKALNSGLEERVAERTAALEMANEKLKELDRLKSEFLATMSHELRTPLNSIIGFTGIMKQGMAGPVNPEQQKQLELVYGSARHLLGLINDLLDLSRIEAGRLQIESQEFAPVEVLQGCVESLAPMVRLKHLVCRVEDGAPGLLVQSDRKRFLQIVMNLANNAVKFTEHGSVTLSLRRDETQFQLRVTDTGPGIKPEQIDGLFQAFRQLDGSARRVYEGTGLGLYLCRKLATLLGGNIGVESEFGRGSTFWVSLPVASLEPSKAEAPLLRA